jgi:hypothetical protein
MSFFMNPFTADFKGNWVLGDRQFSLTFSCPGNKGRSDDAVQSWQHGPYDMSGADVSGNSRDVLLLSYSLDNAEFRTWVMIPVNCTTGAANIAAVTAAEVVSALNTDPNFKAYFTAFLSNGRVVVKQNLETGRMKFFVAPGRAEEALRFNARAGVAELPTYFDRHTVGRRHEFLDGVGMLVYLDPAVLTHRAMITGAVDGRGNSLGYDYTVVQPDWQLLKGRSGLFQFTKVAGGTSIVYPAGARAGDLAMMIVEDGGNRFEMPYTLTDDDLVLPP